MCVCGGGGVRELVEVTSDGGGKLKRSCGKDPALDPDGIHATFCIFISLVSGGDLHTVWRVSLRSKLVNAKNGPTLQSQAVTQKQ